MKIKQKVQRLPKQIKLNLYSKVVNYLLATYLDIFDLLLLMFCNFRVQMFLPKIIKDKSSLPFIT